MNASAEHSDVLGDGQECRVYESSEWYRLIDYVLYLKHCRAYRHTVEGVRGRLVLDFGCGSGYGAAILAETAAEVIGVDGSPHAIAFASAHYNRPNLRFIEIPPNYALPFDGEQFDVVTSHQVIEHIPDVPAYLALLKRVLKPGGKLYITTPNRTHRLLPFQRIWQEAHVREYAADQLRRDLEGVFDRVELLGLYGDDALQQVYVDAYRQTPFRAYLRQPIRDVTRAVLPRVFYERLRDLLGLAASPKQKTPLPREVLEQYGEDQVIIGPDLERAIDFFAVCGK